jgi:hypothetical protein
MRKILFFCFFYSFYAYSADYYYVTHSGENNCPSLNYQCSYADTPQGACSVFENVAQTAWRVNLTLTFNGSNCVDNGGALYPSPIVFDSSLVQPDPDPTICSDGFPPDLWGIPGCDREEQPKQCPNGDIIPESHICPTDNVGGDAPATCSDPEVSQGLSQFCDKPEYNGYLCHEYGSFECRDSFGNPGGPCGSCLLADTNPDPDPDPEPSDPIIGSNLESLVAYIEQHTRNTHEALQTTNSSLNNLGVQSSALQGVIDTLDGRMADMTTSVDSLADTNSQAISELKDSNETGFASIASALNGLANNSGTGELGTSNVEMVTESDLYDEEGFGSYLQEKLDAITDSLPSEQVDISATEMRFENMLTDRTCPAPLEFTINEEVITIPLDYICMFAELLAPLLLALSTFMGARIIFLN